MDQGHDQRLINDAVVRDRLDELVRAGRRPAEAVGEELFIKNKQDDIGALSSDARKELDDINDEWLRAKTGDENVAAHRFIANTYADFLAERVSWELGTDVPSQIQAALHEWRAQHP